MSDESMRIATLKDELVSFETVQEHLRKAILEVEGAKNVFPHYDDEDTLKSLKRLKVRYDKLVLGGEEGLAEYN